MCADPAFWAGAGERDTVMRALKVAVFVGTALIAINQGDVILSGTVPPVWKVALTYLVPYGVSTYSAAAFKATQARRLEDGRNAAEPQ